MTLSNPMWIMDYLIGGIPSVPRGYDEAARTFGANKWQRFRHVELPATLLQIFVGLRLNIGVEFLTGITAEFFESTNGIGCGTLGQFSLPARCTPASWLFGDGTTSFGT